MIGNSNRIKIILIIGKYERITASECFKIFNEKYKSRIRRETVYHEMESLLSAGLLNKHYETKSKKLLYSLKFKKILINLCTMKIQELES